MIFRLYSKVNISPTPSFSWFFFLNIENTRCLFSEFVCFVNLRFGIFYFVFPQVVYAMIPTQQSLIG